MRALARGLLMQDTFWPLPFCALLAATSCGTSLAGRDKCLQEADCLAGYHCVAGKCLQRSTDGRLTCGEQGACLQGELCFSGVCAARCDDTSCAEGQRCFRLSRAAEQICGSGQLGSPCDRAADCLNEARCALTVSGDPGRCAADELGAMRVERIAVVDANTRAELIGISGVEKRFNLDLGPYARRSINLRAQTVPDVVGSVRFVFDSDVEVENTNPYLIAGDVDGAFRSWKAINGTHLLEITPFASLNATGRAGATRMLELIIRGAPGEPTGDAGIDGAAEGRP